MDPDPPRIPLLLDTDVGSNIDDSLALAYLLRRPPHKRRAAVRARPGGPPAPQVDRFNGRGLVPSRAAGRDQRAERPDRGGDGLVRNGPARVGASHAGGPERDDPLHD